MFAPLWRFVSRFLHYGPVTAIAIIKTISVMTLYMNSSWWPTDSLAGHVNQKLFILWSTLTTIHFFMASAVGPKHVPLKWRPPKESQTSCLQYCKVCEGFKAPRSHHCRKCNRCVLRMDHHCPWINNCVGWGNQAYFIYFLSFAVIGCSHATFILLGSLIRGIHRYHYLYHGQYELATVEFTKVSLVLCILSLGLAIGVVIAVGMLLFFQIRAVCRNRTVIEDWILEKAKYRREGTGETFIFPYNLGCWRNVQQVLPAPFSCATVGDGIWWEVNEQSDQFTLTVEQLAQKDEKRQRTRTYTITRPATGSWCPIWSQGWRVGFQPPCTDEARIALRCKDVVHVTRWKKHWLFGETEPSEWRPDAVKGWFPRRCAVSLVENNDQGDRHSKHHHRHGQATKHTSDRKRK